MSKIQQRVNIWRIVGAGGTFGFLLRLLLGWRTEQHVVAARVVVPPVVATVMVESQMNG